jgi:hypothetical protein
MKYIPLLLFIFLSGSVLGQGRIEMNVDDMSKIEAGPGYVITYYQNDSYLDSNKVFCEIFHFSDFDSGFPKQRGILCFELVYGHHWLACDCEPIDSAIMELQARYKYDKEFKRHGDSCMRAALDRFEKNYKSEHK